MTVHRFMTRPEKRGGCAAPVRETQIWSIVSLPQFGIIATGDSSGNVTIWDVVTSTAVKVFHPVSSYYYDLLIFYILIFYRIIFYRIRYELMD